MFTLDDPPQVLAFASPSLLALREALDDGISYADTILDRLPPDPYYWSHSVRYHAVHVLDRTSGGTPVAPADQQRIADELTGVTFVADRNSVVVTEGCAHVKDGGILITLGTIDGGGSPAAGR